MEARRRIRENIRPEQEELREASVGENIAISVDKENDESIDSGSEQNDDEEKKPQHSRIYSLFFVFIAFFLLIACFSRKKILVEESNDISISPISQQLRNELADAVSGKDALAESAASLSTLEPKEKYEENDEMLQAKVDMLSSEVNSFLSNFWLLVITTYQTMSRF
jgi:hypothetical protein